MASKKKTKKSIITMLDIPTSKYLNDTTKQYSISTIERAVPGIDGLKDAQRKAIYILSKVNGEIKTISAAGSMIQAGIYEHGDMSAAGTLSKLASPVDNNYPFIGSRGGMGTQTDNNAASPRYTYVKRNNFTNNVILKDFDIIPMKPNYDGSTYEPQYFLPLIPLALLGVFGISVGYRPNILPRKIEDVIDNCINELEGKKLKYMKPYFRSTGASENVDQIDERSYKTYGVVEILDSSTIKIKGLPVGLKIEKYLEKLINMIDEKQIRDYDDNSKEFIELVIKLPRGIAKNWTEKDALKYMSLIETASETIVYLDENLVVHETDDPFKLIREYVIHRKRFFYTRYEKMIADLSKKLTVARLYKSCFEKELPKKISKLANKKELIKEIGKCNLKSIGADYSMVEALAGYPTYRWTVDNYDENNKRIDELCKEIDLYKSYLNDKKVTEIYIKELKELRTSKF